MASNGPASINQVLRTPALRTDLVALVALVSDSMRRDLVATFDPLPSTHPASDQSGDLLIEFSEESVIQKRPSSNVQRQNSDLNKPETQYLRRAALEHFDKWQIDVLRRLGEALSVRPDAIRKARAGAKAQAEIAAKAKRDAQYNQWAGDIDIEERNLDNLEDHDGIIPAGFKSEVLNMARDERTVVLDSVLLLLLSLQHYSAHSRVLISRVTRVFRLPMSTLVEHESKVAEGLLDSAAAQLTADASTQRQASNQAISRGWKIGLATVAGAALIGVTGGLAAPILAGSLGTLMGGIGLGAVASLLGPLATNVVLVGGLFGAYGGRMTGNIMSKYAGEVKDFKFLPLADINRESNRTASSSTSQDDGVAQLKDTGARKSHKLRVAIGISGSISQPGDFTEPWKVFSTSRIESFGLQWETDTLMRLSRKTSEVLQNYAVDFAGYQLLSLIVAGLWPFGILRAASVLDNPFAVAKTRADKAGLILADALIERAQGQRPVTLVGYSLGSRIIYSCLLQLAKKNAFGLVENVVLMGSPVPSDSASWRLIRAVVAGRVVNVHSADDFILGFLYRASSAQLGIAGVQRVDGVAGIENYNVTDMINGHDKYRCSVGSILQRIGFEDLDIDAVKSQQAALEKLTAKTKQHRDDRPSEQQQEDCALAREDEEGQIIIVGSASASKRRVIDFESPTSQQKPVAKAKVINDDLTDDEDMPAMHTIQLTDNDEGPLAMLDPEPEPEL